MLADLIRYPGASSRPCRGALPQWVVLEGWSKRRILGQNFKDGLCYEARWQRNVLGEGSGGVNTVKLLLSGDPCPG